MSAPLHAVVLAAGEGKRLRGSQPKVLTPLWGRASVAWTVAAARAAGAEEVVVVAGADDAALRKALPSEGVVLATQPEPRGTGHAVACAAEPLAGKSGSLLVLYGDCPLVTPQTLTDLVEVHREAEAAATLLTAELDDPAAYGRIVRDLDGRLTAVVEAGDADDDVRAIREVNTGMWVVEMPGVFDDVARLGTANAQGEVYLTDLVGVLVERGATLADLRCADPDECLGFNDQAELALVRNVLRWRILEEHLQAGVEIVDPASTFIDADVEIAAGARILPGTVIEGRTSIAAGCEVGPFSHLRDGTVLKAGAEVGNFTETKKTVLGEGAKAKHLTYLGDAEVGAKSNIGAGTITANYDGKAKHKTVIGKKVFIGSGTVVVAPAKVEDGATTGAGAIVTRDSKVGRGETWVGVPAKKLDKRKDG